MEKRALIWGSVLGLSSVILGAFGAHALETLIESKQLNAFETGVRYQMFHAIVLLILGFQNKVQFNLVIKLMIIGTILFSVSIYLLSVKEMIGIPVVILGPITPIGGSILILSWSILVFRFLKND